MAAGRRDLAEGQDERADVTAALPEDHHEPVGRLDLVDDLHAEIRECPLQCARPLNETNQRDVDAVDRHRVRIHRAERGDGVTVSATGSVHRRNKRSTVLIAPAYGPHATAPRDGRLRLVGLRAKQPGATDDCRSVAGVC